MKLNVWDSRRNAHRVNINLEELSSEVSIAQYRKIEALDIGQEWQTPQGDVDVGAPLLIVVRAS